MRMRPPLGIACAAFRSTLWKTWLICAASMSTSQRSLGRVSSKVTSLETARAQKLAASRTTGTIDPTRFTGVPPFAKVTSCLARSRARFAACSASASSVRVPGPMSSCRAARDSVPENDREHVVEVVRNAPGEDAERLELRYAEEVLLDTFPLRHVLHDDDRALVSLIVGDRRPRHLPPRASRRRHARSAARRPRRRDLPRA